MMAQPQPDEHSGSPNAAKRPGESRPGESLRTPLDHARLLTARGWVVGPADHPDASTHCTCPRGAECTASHDPTKRGKHPRVRWSELQAPASERQLVAWFAARDAGGGPYGEATNVLVACGPSRLLVVDEDELAALRRFAASIGETVPDTFTVTTGRGRHLYFELPAGSLIGNSPGVLADWHCDIRGGASRSGEFGGYVIGPGSMHYTGTPYRFGGDPFGPVAPAPAWLLDAIGRPSRAQRRAHEDRASRGNGGGVAGTREGQEGGTGRSERTRHDDGPRYGTIAALVARYRTHLDSLRALALSPAEKARGQRPNGGEFRWELWACALQAHRMVALGLVDETAVLGEIADAVAAVWSGVRDPRSGAEYSGEPDSRDEAIVWNEAAPAAEASPWIVTGADRSASASAASRADRGRFRSPAEAAQDRTAVPGLTSADAPADRTTDGNRTVDAATQGEPPVSVDEPVSTPAADDHDTGPEQLVDDRVQDRLDDEGGLIEYPSEDEIAREERKLRKRERRRERKDRRRHAFEQLAARRWAEDEWTRRHAEPIEYLTLSQLLAEAPAEYLVPDMIYRDSLAVMFGGPGSGKSFVALDIALSLVSGREWRPGFENAVLSGRDGGPGVAHYVMAEGRRSNRKRSAVWAHYREVPAALQAEIDGRLTFIPNVIPLSEAGVRQYLKRVRADKPDLVILDTRNPMFVGHESSGDDYGAMIRVLHMIRTAGNCAVLLLDHSGLTATDRTRGSNAQQAGIDTEIKVEEVDGLRIVTMTRDKDEGVLGGEAAQWGFRFHAVEDMPGYAGKRPPVVLVPAQADSTGPLRKVTPWSDIQLSEKIIKVIMDTPGKGKGDHSPAGIRAGRDKLGAAHDCVRLLLGIGLDDQGQTTQSVCSMIHKQFRGTERDHADPTIKGALALLRRAGVVVYVPGERGQTQRQVLDTHWHVEAREWD